jgi:hypothetical protein
VTDRLKAWLDEQDRTLPSESRDWYKAARALRAVVELHKPVESDSGPYGYWCAYCHNEDGEPNFYPCATIRIIEKEVLK